MAIVKTTVTRDLDAEGDAILTYSDGDTTPRLVQGMALTPEVMGDAVSGHYISAAVENVASVKATPGRAFHVDVSLPGVAADRWLMLINKAAAPIAADPAVRQQLLPSGTVYAKLDFPNAGYGHELSAGVAVAISTTPSTLTLPGGSEAWFTVDYL